MENKDITKTYVPILTVVSIVFTIASVVWFTAVEHTKITIVQEDISKLQTEMRNVPSRDEYNDLKSSIKEVISAVDKLREAVLKK